MKKILIVYATAGEGHKRAAYALKHAFDERKDEDVEVKLIDSLNYTNKTFKYTYSMNYLTIIKYFPTIWGFFYYLFDLGWMYPIVKMMRRIVNRINGYRFEKFLCNYNPDIVLSTHFLACEVVSYLKRKNRLDTKLVTCVTDSRMHSFWYFKETDHFCVGFEETKRDLTDKWGCEEEKISILGIPVGPKFFEAKKKEKIYDDLRIRRNMFTILVTGGGFGVGPILTLVAGLLKITDPLQILVVCGHNADLRRKINRLSRKEKPSETYLKAYGFIDYMDELMTVSDLMVTKAGGLICAEAIAKELPLIIVNPIPGQEGRNCRLLLKERVAFKIENPQQLNERIKEIHPSPRKKTVDKKVLGILKENVRRIRTPNSSGNIAKFVMGIKI